MAHSSSYVKHHLMKRLLALNRNITVKPLNDAHALLLTQHNRHYSCNSCEPPKKKSECKPKIKECDQQCPLDHDLPMPPSPMPGRPPQPERCKDKFTVKKYDVCPQACPPPKKDPCGKTEDKKCGE